MCSFGAVKVHGIEHSCVRGRGSAVAAGAREEGKGTQDKRWARAWR